MIKKQIWLTSLATMTMVLQLMAPALAAQTTVGNDSNGADFKAQLSRAGNSPDPDSLRYCAACAFPCALLGREARRLASDP